LPGYLQKSMAENKRFRGLRIEWITDEVDIWFS
jgi:hypothetical protein